MLDTEERTDDLFERAKTEAETYLESIRSQVDDGSRKVDCAVAVHRSTARAILKHVVQSDSDLVVLKPPDAPSSSRKWRFRPSSIRRDREPPQPSPRAARSTWFSGTSRKVSHSRK